MIDFKQKSPKILVIGDLMIDHYLWGSSERISPEAPVQIVDIYKENTVLGGAGNVINNLQALGAKVDVISVIGDCKIAAELKDLLGKISVNTGFLVVQKNRLISKKSRLIAAQQQVIRFDSESADEINLQAQNAIKKTFEKIITKYDLVLLSDYGKGVLTAELTQFLIRISNENSKKILVDPKGQNYAKYQGAYLLTPNKKEASEATNINITDEKSLARAIKQLKNECNLAVSLITLSEQGVAIFDNQDEQFRTHPTVAREVFDVTGAGDTILAALGFALAGGADIDSAVQFSNLAAGIVVGKIGSATATLSEIIKYQSSLKKSSIDENIKTLSEISAISAELKSRGKKVVFTNGCFDLLHAGHVRYLEAAKSFGDVLILGLNSDRSTQTLKGKSRPINAQTDRAYLLAALIMVDFVVIFDEETPLELIKIIRPDILIKGGDYAGKKVVGEDIAGELKLVEFVAGKSTTNIIKKIQKL